MQLKTSNAALRNELAASGQGLWARHGQILVAALKRSKRSQRQGRAVKRDMRGTYVSPSETSQVGVCVILLASRLPGTNWQECERPAGSLGDHAVDVIVRVSAHFK
jgi:hypothetical protein